MEAWRNDYLMHYGVKGQKWGVRRFGRKKNVTGNGKGVSKRGEGLGTGPVGSSDGYASRFNGDSSSGSNKASTSIQVGRLRCEKAITKKGNVKIKSLHSNASAKSYVTKRLATVFGKSMVRHRV